jgi:hypothetical protein
VFGFWNLLLGLASLVVGFAVLLFTVWFWVYCLFQGGSSTVAMLLLLAFFVMCGAWVVHTWRSIKIPKPQ